MKERRKANRIRVNLAARWEGLSTQGNGAVSDISPSGCFLLAGGEVKARELIRLSLHLPNDQTISQWGEVVYPVTEIGFSLRFVFNSEDEAHALDRLIETLPILQS